MSKMAVPKTTENYSLCTLVKDVKTPPIVINRETTCPFLLRAFCSDNGKHNSGIFYARFMQPENELQIYTWMDATLHEIVTLIKEIHVPARFSGTVFDFDMVYPARSGSGFHSSHMGNVVLGNEGDEDSKTLHECSFVIGNFLDVAISMPAYFHRRSFYSHEHDHRGYRNSFSSGMWKY